MVIRQQQPKVAMRAFEDVAAKNLFIMQKTTIDYQHTGR